MKQKVYLDMDGTIADLYGIPNWLGALRSEQVGLFLSAKPLITEEQLFELFPRETYEIIILSMTPKGASERYCRTVKSEKNAWLSMFFPNIEKRIYQEYGNDKNLENSATAILIDDNEIIRSNWLGLALNPMELW